MSLLSSWLAWANVPFVTALAIAVLFAILQATGLIGVLAGGDHDGAHDGDADGADGADHDGSADGDADGDSEHEGFSIAGLLGVGRVPLTFLLQCFAVTLGIAGLSLHTLVFGLRPPPNSALLWSIPGSLVIAFALTSAIARAAAKIFSTEGQEAKGRAELVGATGVVISSKVDREFGEVRLSAGTTTVRVVVSTEDDAPIPEGRDIVVVEYDRQRDRLIVSCLDAAAPDRPSKPSGVA